MPVSEEKAAEKEKREMCRGQEEGVDCQLVGILLSDLKQKTASSSHTLFSWNIDRSLLPPTFFLGSWRGGKDQHERGC